MARRRQGSAGKALHQQAESWAHAVGWTVAGYAAVLALGVASCSAGLFGTTVQAGAGQSWLGWCLLSYHGLMLAVRLPVLGTDGVYNQLWACNVAMTGAAVGILTGRPAMVGGAAGVVAIDQFLWYGDVAAKLATGRFVIGVARYLDEPDLPWQQTLTSSHHLWFLPLCVLHLRAVGPGMPAGALQLCLFSVLLVMLITRFATPARLNVNMAFSFWPDVEIRVLHLCDGKPANVYVPWILAVFNLVNLPVWPLLVWLAGGYPLPAAPGLP